MDRSQSNMRSRGLYSPLTSHDGTLLTPDQMRPQIVVATPQEAERFARITATALMAFELQATDINIDGMYIDTSWLSTEHVRTSHSPTSGIPIEQAINQAYPEGSTATLSISGVVEAREAMRFLRAVYKNNLYGGAPLTRMALLKDWTSR